MDANLKTKIIRIKILFLKATFIAFAYELLVRTLISPMVFWIIRLFNPNFINPDLPSLQPILQKTLALMLGAL